MVGHDIGMMVAYAFARRFSKQTERLVAMEAPLPGMEAYRTSFGTRTGSGTFSPTPPRTSRNC